MAPSSGVKVDRSRAGERPSERAVADLWKMTDTLAEGLTTQDGRRFRVIYPGRASSRAGPDFRDAIVATEDGVRLTGDVELHLRAPDWYAHGHDVDPNYNGVILHVVLWPRGETTSRQRSHMNAPVVAIAPEALGTDRGGASRRSGMLRPDRAGQATLGEMLDRAGDERFLARSRGFTVEMANAKPEQVLYAALLEVLGYSSNRKPFRKLAERVPIASLSRLRSEPATTRLMAIKAMLVCASGLLSHLQPPEEATLLRRLFRVRPSNHPIHRIVGAAQLVDRYVETGLVSGLARVAQRGDARSLLEALVVGQFVGERRASDILVNAVLPFMHAWSGAGAEPTLGRTCVELYRGLPKLQDNDITREMGRLLGPEYDDLTTINARRQQGLMHIYRRLAKTR